MRNRESYDFQLREPLAVKEKTAQPGSRFNETVAEFLKQEFEEHGDVRRDFVTHAFPIQNLAGIVEEGGLRTAEFLRRKKGEVPTQGSKGGGVYGSIYFGAGMFHEQYTKGHGDEAGLLFPAQEFQRLKRLRSGYHKRGEELRKVLESSWEAEYGEFFVTSEDVSGDYIAHAAKRLTIQKQEAERVKVGDELQRRLQQAKDHFEQEVAKLKVNQLPQHADEARDAHLESLYQQIQRQALDYIAQAQIDLLYKRGNAQMSKNHLLQLERNAQKELPQLRPGILEKVGLGGSRRKARIAELENMRQQQQEKVATAEQEVARLEQSIAETEQQRRDVDAYKVLLRELDRKITQAHDTAIDKGKDIEQDYEIGNWGPKGRAAQTIKERLRKLHGIEEIEQNVQADLSHAIILLEKRHALQALDALKSKPGLRARVLVFDGDQFPQGERFSEIRLNRVFEVLATSKDGLALLQTAQLGGRRDMHSSIDGIWRLEDYVADMNKGIMRKVA